ncbi:hypothetical protein N0V90_007941 [Kalmusia sp. IMI 367209]|nr:hypothetical protein N0V90_007941 [Kalmusia sp. IMI 367209]
MRLPYFVFVVLFWLSSVAPLWFSPGFNGTIPSILGLTDFSYPVTDTNIETGFADGVVNTIFHQPWPSSTLGPRTSHFIRYCYADQASKDALECNLGKAMSMWKEALNGPPSKATGYSLWFIEKFFQAGIPQGPLEYHFCYKEGTYDSKKGTGTWNYRLAEHQDTLVVAYRPVDEYGDRPATASTVGYTPEEYLFGRPAAGRHYMQIADADDVRSIAHELGHGDMYLEYRSQNIRGYYAALHSAISSGLSEAEAKAKLQDDYLFCTQHNFRGSAFVKGADQPGFIAGSNTLDLNSIMIYPSFAEAADPAACQGDISKCTLAKRAGRNPDGGLKFEHIWPGPGPSEVDAEFVRKHYPWDGKGQVA